MGLKSKDIAEQIRVEKKQEQYYLVTTFVATKIKDIFSYFINY